MGHKIPLGKPALLSLAFFCSLHSYAFAVNDYVRGGVFISPEGVRFTDSFGVKGVTYEDKVLSSDRRELLFHDRFMVRNMRSKVGSVLISRPEPTDMRIVSFLEANSIGSLNDYAGWLEKNIAYKADPEIDFWSAPTETLERGYGDCEDFAFLTAAVLRVMGYRPKALAMETSGVMMGRLVGNHAICAFQMDGKYFWFDNGKLKKSDASSFNEFTSQIIKKCNLDGISEIELETKKRKKIYDEAAKCF